MKHPRKIVHLIDSMNEGGTQEFLLNYLAFSTLEHTEITLLQLNASNAYRDEIAALPCRHLIVSRKQGSLTGKLNPVNLLKLYRVLRRIRPDILHARLHLSLIMGLLAARLAGIRIVLYTIEGSFTQAHSLYRYMVKLLSGWIDLIFTGYPQEYRHARLPEKKYREYRVCLFFEDKLRGHLDIRPLEIPPGGPNLASVGRLHKDKGHHLAIEAISRLVSSYPRIRLFIAGTGPFQGELEQRVKALSLQDHVVFCGFVKDIGALWRKMDLCLQCTVNENLNLSSLWALRNGVPVITFAIPFLKDQIDVEKHQIGLRARYLSTKDLCAKIDRLLRNPEQGTRLSANARRFVDANYDARASAAYYDGIYRKLLWEKSSCAE